MPTHSQDWKDLEERAIAVLKNNRKSVRKKGVDYGFTCPSPTQYHWQWLWDSCFHAVALRWNEPDFAKGEIVSLLSGQWKDGRVPNMVHVGVNWRFDWFVHGTGRSTSGITQPPLIAMAALKVYEATQDRAFLEKVYEPLRRYYAWLEAWRDTEKDGLIAMFHPWETGIDNSPRWDSIFDIKKFNRKWFNITKGLVMMRFNLVRYDNEKMRKVSPYYVKGIDMNSYYYANLKYMADIARLLNKGADAENFETRAEKTKQSIMSKMWDSEKKVFFDLIGEENVKSYVPTPFSFMPMWAGLVDREQADGIHAEIKDPKRYWTEYAVPTTAMDHPMFDPFGYWRGTTWLSTNWLMIEALAKYGYGDTAAELRERTLRMVDKGGFREYFNPLTAEGLGTESFGWTTLVIDLIHRDFKKEADDAIIL